VQLPEYVCQAALTAFMLLTGHWWLGGLHLVMTGFLIRQVGLHSGSLMLKSRQCQSTDCKL
jgi:hypothetical protein